MQCCDEAMQKARWNSKETVVAQERRFTLRYTNSTPDKYVDINFRDPMAQPQLKSKSVV